MFRPSRPGRRRVHAHRPDGHLRRQGRPRAVADGLAGAVIPAVLRRHRGQPAGRAPPAIHQDPAPDRRGGQRRVPRPDRPRDGRRRGHLHGRTGGRGRPAGRGAGTTHRADGRHRRHHPVRAGPDHPRRPGRDHGRAGRPRHRQDRRGPAPCRVPALQPPRPTRAARRADHRTQPDVPRLHQPGAALARRERGGAVHHRRPLPRRFSAGDRRTGRRTGSRAGRR